MIRDFMRDIEKYKVLDDEYIMTFYDEHLAFEQLLENSLPLTDDEVVYILEQSQTVTDAYDSWVCIIDALESNPKSLTLDGFLLLDMNKFSSSWFDSFRYEVYNTVTHIKSSPNLPSDISFKTDPDEFIQAALQQNLSRQEFLFLIEVAGREQIRESTKELLREASDSLHKVSPLTEAGFGEYEKGFDNIGCAAILNDNNI